MAQYDVLRVTGNVLVLDCQADVLSDLPTRFVVPLRADDRIAMPRLTPVFDVQGQRLVMVTPLARSISRRDILERVQTLADQEYVIKAALDMLISGF